MEDWGDCLCKVAATSSIVLVMGTSNWEEVPSGSRNKSGMLPGLVSVSPERANGAAGGTGGAGGARGVGGAGGAVVGDGSEEG